MRAYIECTVSVLSSSSSSYICWKFLLTTIFAGFTTMFSSTWDAWEGRSTSLGGCCFGVRKISGHSGLRDYWFVVMVARSASCVKIVFLLFYFISLCLDLLDGLLYFFPVGLTVGDVHGILVLCLHPSFVGCCWVCS